MSNPRLNQTKENLAQKGRTCISEKRLKKGAAEHVYCLKDGKTGWQNLYIGKKIEKKGAAEHVYCLKDGKTGWKNLYIGKKIEKRGRRNMYTA